LPQPLDQYAQRLRFFLTASMVVGATIGMAVIVWPQGESETAERGILSQEPGRTRRP
jgi:hypothetical protein